MKNKICLALDVDTVAQAKDLVIKTQDYVGMYKVGMQLYTNEGPKIIATIKELGGRVFLDLKYHDIPNTVAQAGLVAARMGVDIFNIHTLGGCNMMRAVSDTLKEESLKTNHTMPKVLGVTILTSMSENELNKELKVNWFIDHYILHLAELAKQCHLDGVVCSARELYAIKNAIPNFICLTPGIRPLNSDRNDQQRTTTPSEAISKGADYIVIGRPITHAEDPTQAARDILESLLCTTHIKTV